MKKYKVATNNKLTASLVAIGVIFVSLVGTLAVMTSSASIAMVYNYSSNLPEDSSYNVTVNGQNSFVYSTQFGAFTAYTHSGGTDVLQINYATAVNSIEILPKSKYVNYSIEANSVFVDITEPGNYSVEINGTNYPLFVFANPPETNIPDKNDPNVLYYEAGAIYDVGELIIKSNKTLYVEGGAVLRGKIRLGTCCTSGATESNINIRGYGIVDSTFLTDPGRPLRINRSNNVTIDGPVFLGTEAWGAVAFESDQVSLNNIKVINWRSTNNGTPDGIDIVGSSNVSINDVFIRSYDDGIAIKNNKFGWSGNVDTVNVSGAVIWNGDAGNGLEIGYENNSEYIRNVNYSDIDIIRKTARSDPYSRAAIGIHAIDGGSISDISYNNVRVGPVQENYIYISAFKTSSSITSNIANIQDITFNDVNFEGDPKALPIIIKGYDANNIISNITFNNLKFGEELINSSDQLNIQQTFANNIIFNVDEIIKNGDINSDGVVDIVDLSILLSNWGDSNAQSDLNNSGTVDIVDLSILLSNWG